MENKTTIDTLLGHHNGSNGDYSDLMVFLRAEYESAKRISIDDPNSTHLHQYEENLWKHITAKKLTPVVNALGHVAAIYQNKGMPPTEDDHVGKYRMIGFLNNVRAFAEILTAKDQSGWREY